MPAQPTFARHHALTTGCLLDVEPQLLALRTALKDGSAVLSGLQLLELAAVVDADVLLNLMHLAAPGQLLHHVKACRVGVPWRQAHVVVQLALFFEVLVSLVVTALHGEGKEAGLRVRQHGLESRAYNSARQKLIPKCSCNSSAMQLHAHTPGQCQHARAVVAVHCCRRCHGAVQQQIVHPSQKEVVLMLYYNNTGLKVHACGCVVVQEVNSHMTVTWLLYNIQQHVSAEHIVQQQQHVHPECPALSAPAHSPAQATVARQGTRAQTALPSVPHSCWWCWAVAVPARAAAATQACMTVNSACLQQLCMLAIEYVHQAALLPWQSRMQCNTGPNTQGGLTKPQSITQQTEQCVPHSSKSRCSCCSPHHLLASGHLRWAPKATPKGLPNQRCQPHHLPLCTAAPKNAGRANK